MNNFAISKLTKVKVVDLVAYPGNPRRGDVAAIKSSLENLQQFAPIVVNRGTNATTKNAVLSGNHTLMAAKELGWEDIQVVFVDVDDNTAAKIVLAANRTSDVAKYDDDLLLDLLNSLPDLDGTGYETVDLDQLAAELDSLAAAMPGTLDTPASRNRTETAPTEFASYDVDVATDYSCPRCQYAWSGKAKGATAPQEDE